MGGCSVAREWGSTAGERALPFPCDRHLAAADDALFRAVSVDAPPDVVFRWLCQLKVAPYSYDWIDNFGRRSPRELTPGLDALAVGQRFMSLFTLVEFEPDRHLTFLARLSFAGEYAVTYLVVPGTERCARLVVKLLVRHPRGPFGWVLRQLAPWADVVMMRKQLLTLKHLAEKVERAERWWSPPQR